jgi:hypothetical protein
VARDLPTGDRAERFERRPVSDRRARPEATGCFPAEATARRQMNDPFVETTGTWAVFAGIDWPGG